MKKMFFATAAIWLGAMSFTFAQVEKGNWLLGGSSNLEFNSDKEKVKTDNDTHETGTCRDFDFRPEVGYFVIDKLPVGIAMDISLDKMKYSDSDSEYTWNDYVFGPFVRYYIANLDGFMPFAEASLGFGGGKQKSNYGSSENEEKYSVFGYKLGVGGTYFITNSVGVDLFIGYKMDQQTYKDQNEEVRSDGNVTYSYGGLDFNLGFVISISK